MTLLHTPHAPDPGHERRARILDAAERCFIRNGFHRTTMQDVAAEAGMSAGNLYRYFPSKDAIQAGLAERDREEMSRDFAAMANAEDFFAAFERIGRKHLIEDPRDKMVLAVEIWSEATRNPEVARFCCGMEDDVRGFMSDVFRDAKRKGQIHPGVDPAVARLAADDDGGRLLQAPRDGARFRRRGRARARRRHVPGRLCRRPPPLYRPSGERRGPRFREHAMIRPLIGAAALAAILSPLPVFAQEKPAATTETRTLALPGISTAKAERRRMVERLVVSGNLVARDEALVAPEVDGLRVMSLHADEGDKVEAGQVLARLSRDTLEAQMAQNAAAIARAEAAIAQANDQIPQADAALTEAKAALARTVALRESGNATLELLDQRTAAARTARGPRLRHPQRPRHRPGRQGLRRSAAP